MTNEEKWKYSLCAGVVFFVVSNPELYKYVDKLLSGVVGRIASPSGCPTMTGLLLHTLVFVTLIRLLMDYKK